MKMLNKLCLLGACIGLLFLTGCGSSGPYWGSLRGYGAQETSAWMAGGTWKQCARGKFGGRNIGSFSETKTCVDNPAGGKICTFYYYYSEQIVGSDWKTWYQDKYDLYVNDGGIVTRCHVATYRLGME